MQHQCVRGVKSGIDRENTLKGGKGDIRRPIPWTALKNGRDAIVSWGTG